jgi:hypothetical protein
LGRTVWGQIVCPFLLAAQTAKALGLTIPESLLLRADDLID